MKLREKNRRWRRNRRIKSLLYDGFASSLRQADVRLDRPKLSFSRSGACPLDATFTREKTGKLAVDFSGPEPDLLVNHVMGKIAPYLYWLVHCPREIERITVNMSDGEFPSAAMFAPSSADPAQILLPDPYFFSFRGFEAYRALSESEARPWSERSPVIRWRGNYYSQGRISFSNEAMYDPTVLQRLRFLMIARQIANVDVGFVDSGTVWLNRVFEQHGYKAARIPETDWINDKFAIDIDGWTNTWSNMLARMHFGCCVLKVGTQFGFRQWYYDSLKPWEHYVPVRSDMSDLARQVDWVRSNPGPAEEIARNGQVFARSMTFASETLRAAEIITGALRGGAEHAKAA
ncbi:glycosyl transferase family 90 [Oricola sp.]|uniref:glycosyl transferase family 90 n=1 Tax=Oricola sp. TaxID=1979950 RepID=UPI003BAAF6CF